MRYRSLLLNWAIAIIVAGATTFSSAQEITIKFKPKEKDKPVKTSTDKQPFKGKRPAVDVAILLDTSNSMDGLISQAKAQLWKIVQEFAAAERSGQTPILRVALFEYGNTNLPAKEGYIRQVQPLTDNLDEISEGLFGLTTNGGDEYCGQVISEAIKRLDWAPETNAYKAIFIAGNEPFTQGSTNYVKSCGLAIEKGIVVNTIHCGNYKQGVNGKWKHGAELAEGEYMNINQDRRVVQIKCPQDEIIIKLNTDLNKTYLWYGAKNVREYNLGNQIRQDSNAQSLGGGGFGSRIVSKAGKLYSNRGRCLVDTFENDKDVLKKVKESELPEAMQKMKPAEREKHLAEMVKKRAEIRSQIAKLGKERAAHIAKVQAEKAAKEGKAADSLGDAITNAVQSQLKKSGFEIRK